MKNSPRFLSVIVIVTLIAAMFIPVVSGAASNVTVAVGGGNMQVSLLAFQPSTVRIAAGDTVTWSWMPGAPHTVTFLQGAEAPPTFIPAPDDPGTLMLNPVLLGPITDGMISSGFISAIPGAPPATFSWTFNEAGTFEYVCLIHPGMLGSVVVEPAGAAVPSAEQVMAAGQAEAVAIMNLAPSIALNNWATTDELAAGTIWNAAAGSGLGNLSIDTFQPSFMTIEAGDTINWHFAHPEEPHTITFLGGADAPPFITPLAQPGGPPMLVVNEAVAMPSALPDETGSVAYAGVGYLNSGLGGVPGLPREWSVTFTEPGAYPYLCLIHPLMQGVINVREADSWPPVVIDGQTIMDVDGNVIFAFAPRNVGGEEVSGVHLAAALPDGTTLVSSWAGSPGTNPGLNTGTSVHWFDPAAGLQPGESRGPYAIAVSVDEGVDLALLASNAWAHFFGDVVGTTASEAVTLAPAGELPPEGEGPPEDGGEAP